MILRRCSLAIQVFLVGLFCLTGCKKNITAWGTPSTDSAVSPLLNHRTEEAWVIQEVCDTVVFLLHPDLIGQPMAAPRIAITRIPGEPASFQVVEGPAKGVIKLETSIWDPKTYQEWCRLSTSEAVQTSPESPDMLKELLTPDTAHLLALEQKLSGLLKQYPRDPALNVDAALLLGTMAWVDAAGHFQDVRPL